MYIILYNYNYVFDFEQMTKVAVTVVDWDTELHSAPSWKRNTTNKFQPLDEKTTYLIQLLIINSFIFIFKICDLFRQKINTKKLMLCYLLTQLVFVFPLSFVDQLINLIHTITITKR